VESIAVGKCRLPTAQRNDGRADSKISDALGVKAKALWNQGVFNAYMAVDSRLHIDPALLRVTRVPEFRESLQKFEEYFTQTFALVRQVDKGPTIKQAAIERLIFHEVKEAAIGYGSKSNKGRGVSSRLGEVLLRTAIEILAAGIEDPIVFELVPLFQDGFGADLLSDMTISVLTDQFSQFNQRVCEKLKIQMAAIPVGAKMLSTAYSESFGRPVLLLPKALFLSVFRQFGSHPHHIVELLRVSLHRLHQVKFIGM
jgi:hypothetical protein